jgi:uncharacterized protein
MMAKYKRILCLDGGGIRGIIPGQVLVNLERLLRSKRGDNARLADCFDLIAGTSTGGILTCAYLVPDRDHPNRPKYSAERAVDIYLERGQAIFDRNLWHRVTTAEGLFDEKYAASGLEAALEDYFGETKLSELLRPCLVTAYDIGRRKTHFFTQHDAKNSEKDDFRVREVARATSAAPTYFEAVRVRSLTEVPYDVIDGGVFANNPALCAYAEARTKLPKCPTASEMVILSLGTGHALKPYSHEAAKDWGLIRWARPLIDILMSGVAETVDYQLKQIFDAVKCPQQYLRLDADLVAHPLSTQDLDNADKANMKRLRDIGQEVAERNEQNLKDIVDLLLEE